MKHTDEKRAVTTPLLKGMLPLLACPGCGSEKMELEGEDYLLCKNCTQKYPLREGIPVLLPAPGQYDSGPQSAEETTSSPARFYNREDISSRYFEHKEPSFDWVKQQQLIKFNPEALTLEVGSGASWYQRQFKPGCYVALDYSYYALSNYIDPRHFRVCGSAESLPFRSDSFDTVISCAALEHVPRPELAYAEILRVLKPGGLGFLFPAWNCEQWNCDGIPVRPYRELTWVQRFTKATLPLRTSLLWKGLTRVPWRIMRYIHYCIHEGPTDLAYKSLRPNYEIFWMSDSDACSSLDVFESVLYFASRGCTVLHPGPSLMKQIFARAEPVIFRKPGQMIVNEDPGSRDARGDD